MAEAKKANHRVNVVRVTEIVTHTNADSLEIIKIEGYQCVVKKGQFAPGSLAIYIQPDSVVPQTEPFKFIWEPYQTDPDGAVPEKRRRITVRKFRGEWSEGLLLPLTDFPDIGSHVQSVGQDVSDLLGITHYDPDAGRESTKGDTTGGPRRRYPKTIKGWFFFLLHKLGFKKAGQQLSEEVSFYLPVYDVEGLKNYTSAFEPGEAVVVTEKIHGSNARFIYFDDRMYAGSRTLWKSPKSNCIWRKALSHNPWIEAWCRKNEDYALYGEVVPTQKGFDYGCAPGEVKFFVFDIRTPNGDWLDKTDIPQEMWDDLAEYWVPRLADFGGAAVPSSRVPGLNGYIPNTDGFDAEKIKKLVDGKSLVPGAKHIREGIVITPMRERHVTGLGRLILKLVSNAFLEKDTKVAAA